MPVSRPRRAYTLVEALVVLAVIAIVSGGAVFSLRGGYTNASDRRAQASVDTVLDAAELSRAASGELPARAVDLVAVMGGRFRAVDAPSPATSTGVVSVFLDPDADVVAAAALGADGACWMARWRPSAPTGQTLEAFGIAPAGASTACRGDLAAQLLSPGGNRGQSWRLPQVLS